MTTNTEAGPVAVLERPPQNPWHSQNEWTNSWGHVTADHAGRKGRNGFTTKGALKSTALGAFGGASEGLTAVRVSKFKHIGWEKPWRGLRKYVPSHRID